MPDIFVTIRPIYNKLACFYDNFWLLPFIHRLETLGNKSGIFKDIQQFCCFAQLEMVIWLSGLLLCI